MSEGLIEAGNAYDPVNHVPQSINDYCSEEDSQPLRIKRRCTSSSKIKHGKALSLKRRRRGAFSSKTSLEKDLTLKRRRRDAALYEESLGKAKVWEDQDAQLTAKIQRDGAFSPEYIPDTGSYIYYRSKEESEIVPPAPLGKLKYDWEAAHDDDLIYHEIGYNFPPRDSNQPELYRICVHTESGEESEESDFINLLTEINCGDRFFVSSIECPAVFYAKLDKEEAAKLRDVEGIVNVFPLSDSVARC